MYEYYPGLNAIQKGFKNIGRIDVLFTKVLKLFTRNLYKKECMVFAILPILISWKKKRFWDLFLYKMIFKLRIM